MPLSVMSKPPSFESWRISRPPTSPPRPWTDNARSPPRLGMSFSQGGFQSMVNRTRWSQVPSTGHHSLVLGHFEDSLSISLPLKPHYTSSHFLILFCLLPYVNTSMITNPQTRFHLQTARSEKHHLERADLVRQFWGLMSEEHHGVC